MASLSLAAGADDSPARRLEHFRSGDRDIRVETFGESANSATTTKPSIIVLHGATGVEFANRFIAGVAESFAAQGFVVHLIHYFDRTGARYADDQTIKRSAPIWLETIRESVAFVRKKRPHARIGLFGYSLGGYLAAAESLRNEHVDAAVVLSGGIDEGSLKAAHHAVPMLLLHGGQDSRVPIAEMRRLAAALEQLGRPAQVHVYPEEGHIMDFGTYADVLLRGTAFFQRQLTPR